MYKEEDNEKNNLKIKVGDNPNDELFKVIGAI